jgi:transcriptional regulator with XRE-family HTH domain
VSGAYPRRILRDPLDEYIGQRVKLRRTELGMSQAQIGQALGVSFQQVQKYERGANRISSATMVRLANALDVSPGYFLDEAPGALHGPKRLKQSGSEGLRLVATTPGAIDALRSLAVMDNSRRAAALDVLRSLADRD